jgi:enterochelin esterase-like enzyme
MLKKFKEASLLVKDVKQREKNYKENNINDSWDDAFKDVLPFMEEKIRGIKDV